MQISISNPAIKWFQRELGLNEGDSVRFYARYGGFGGVHKGFSLAMEIMEPVNPGAEIIENGIRFFVEESDLWYFDEKDFRIKYSRKFDEIEFIVE
ncbi:uncharacterized protein YneR [Gracilibacillus halotolerans]|uniref:Uncharacterized protein YneR n=1 Tax=Gracilibacillus halotolerans TaxID=74386 RepID=A0A841RIJ3_9BACI|nr:HesB/YadR/YfhF family protein [Gracilibacillus halotolerans]MBB6512491.1 uncharacterized protein YneR [Gracilibacillus halotolerans]